MKFESFHYPLLEVGTLIFLAHKLGCLKTLRKRGELYFSGVR